MLLTIVFRVCQSLFIWGKLRVTSPFVLVPLRSLGRGFLNSVLLAQGQPVPPLLPPLQDQSGDGDKVWFLDFMFYAFLFNLGKKLILCYVIIIGMRYERKGRKK